jgi:hypothetical protein
MDVFLLPFIFSFWAAISFLLLLQASFTKHNAVWSFRLLLRTIFQAVHASIQWIGFLFWLFVSSYTGRFWFHLLRWIFIVFFQYVYNFGPKHRKRSLLDILCNPVPGVEFDGRFGESADFDSLRRRRFNHNLVARRIVRNKRFSTRHSTRSIASNIYDCPLAFIDSTAPVLSGYQTYTTFPDMSMDDAISKSDFSMPMTLYFAICRYSCPKFVFLFLPRRPPDGILTSFIISGFIGFIFATMTVRTCFKLSSSSLRNILMAKVQAAIRAADRPIKSRIDSHIPMIHKDSSFWVCDNSATGHICNDRSLFTGDLVLSIYIVGAATGTSEPTLMGTVHL